MIQEYSIFDIGFDKYLSRGTSVLEAGNALYNLPMPSILGSGFYEIPPGQIGSGELVGNITMVTGFLQSYNFETGVDGWQISYDGDVEFNSGVFRGSLVAGSIHIPDQGTTANSFHTDSDGNSWWGCTETNFTADNDNALSYILKTGIAKFQSATVSGLVVGTNVGLGTAQDSAGVTTIVGNVVTTGYVNALSVVAGSVSAENITGTTITGKTIQTSTSGQRIILDGANNNLKFYDSPGFLQATLYGVSAAAGRSAGLGIFGDIRAEGYDAYIDWLFAEGGISVTGNISVTGTVDGVDIAAHDGGAISTYHTGTISSTMHGSQTGIPNAHHTKYTDANARSAVTGTTLPGNLVLGNHEVNDVSYLKFDSSYGKIYYGATEILDFYSTYLTAKVELKMNSENISGIDTLTFDANTGEPASAGQIQYYSSGGTYQFRGNVGGWKGSFDMSAT